MTKRNDHFKIGEICQESGVFRIKGCECKSEQQREIPLAKGHRFPPCRSCTKPIVWEFVRHA